MPPPGGTISRRTVLVATLLAWVPMLVWYAGFRPGIMSADSLEIWRQATEGRWSDLQAPSYTAAMWVSASLLGSPSLLTLAQSLLLAFALVSVGVACVRLGANRTLVIVVTAVLACSPMVGAFSITLWKDIPFTAAFVLIGARLVDLARGRLRADRAVQLAAARGIAGWSVLATLMRQNGIIVVGLVFVVLVVTLPGLRRAVLLGLACCVVAFVGMKAVVQPVLDVGDGPPNSSIATMLHDIAAVAARDGAALDDGDVALLEEVAPIEQWTTWWERFSCRSADWQWQPVFEWWRRVDGRQGRYVDLWFELARENPRAVVENRLCVGAVGWRPDNAGRLYTVSRGIDQNPFGLETRPLVSGLTEPMRDVLDGLDERWIQWLVWRAPFWTYAAYAVVGFTAWRRRTPVLLLPLTPLAALQIAVTALNPAQDARYVFPALLLAVLLLPLATSRAVTPEPPTTPEEASTDDRREPQVPRPATDATGGLRPIETDAG